MKNIIYLLSIITLYSCYRDDTGIMTVDQVARVYIDSAGIDMLNDSLTNSYKTKKITDALGTNNTTVPFVTKKNNSGIYYLEYTAGAVREPIENSSNGITTLRSIIAFEMSNKTISDSSSLPVKDTLVLDYHYTDAYFKLISAKYNGIESLNGKEDGVHRIKIHK